MAKIKNFFKKVGAWFKNHLPTRRRIIQVYAALLTNANLKGFVEGQIYQNTADITAVTKNLCSPGLNCYSCPGAVAACPLGALQNSLGSANTTTPYYILGILALLGLSLGRTICGFLCPFGLLQDLLYKIKTPKVKKSAYTRLLSYLKYLLLIVMVIAVPLIYHNVPAFCKYICPAGTFEGSVGLLSNQTNADFYSMLDYLFSWKFVLFIMFVVLCIFAYRGFCRFFCPLGAIYGFFNKIALLGVRLEKSKCIDCGMCISKCKMDIKHVGDHECINCGECISVCPTKAISWKGSQLFLAPTSAAITAAGSAEAAAPTLNSLIASGSASEVQPEVLYAPQSEITETVAEVEIIPQSDTQDNIESSAPKQTKKEHYERKKSSKILEIVAWALAAIILISALVYYNTLPPVKAEFGEKIEGFTAQTYQTAYDGDEYTLYERSDKPTVIVFWSSRNETSIEYLTAVGSAYDQISERANLLAVHVVNNDSEEEVSAKIAEKGLNSLKLPVIQDTDELELYELCGGTGAFPTTAVLNIHSEVYSCRVGELSTQDILTEINDVCEKTVYREGDRMFDFTVETYQSLYTQGSFSTESARGKVLVLNFWYISCSPCVGELPDIEEIQKRYSDKVVTVALHSNNFEVGRIPNYLANETSWGSWNIIFGQDIGANKYFNMYGGKTAYPLTAVIDAEGYVVKIIQGEAISNNRLLPAIEEALNHKI